MVDSSVHALVFTFWCTVVFLVLVSWCANMPAVVSWWVHIIYVLMLGYVHAILLHTFHCCFHFCSFMLCASCCFMMDVFHDGWVHSVCSFDYSKCAGMRLAYYLFCYCCYSCFTFADAMLNLLMVLMLLLPCTCTTPTPHP